MFPQSPAGVGKVKDADLFFFMDQIDYNRDFQKDLHGNLWMLVNVTCSFFYCSQMPLILELYCAAGYKLMGFVSHMGTSTHCGHYVAHICKNGRWVIFNDSKVGASIDPPKDMGYLYFFERMAS